MDKELKQLAKINTNEINKLKKQYKNISSLVQGLDYEIFEIIEELDEEINTELFERLIKISRMIDILKNKLFFSL